MVKLAAQQHAFTHRAHGAGLALLRHFVPEVAVVAHTGGVVGVSAGRLHAEESRRIIARCARLTRLSVAEDFGERLTWGEERINCVLGGCTTFSLPFKNTCLFFQLKFIYFYFAVPPKYVYIYIFDMSALNLGSIYLKKAFSGCTVLLVP